MTAVSVFKTLFSLQAIYRLENLRLCAKFDLLRCLEDMLMHRDDMSGVDALIVGEL